MTFQEPAAYVCFPSGVDAKEQSKSTLTMSDEQRSGSFLENRRICITSVAAVIIFDCLSLFVDIYDLCLSSC